MYTMKVGVTLISTIMSVHLTFVGSQVCVLKKRPNPSSDGLLKWSLPKIDLCHCRVVVAPPVVSECKRNEYESDELWFVDDPRPLTIGSSWKKDLLDDLLQRIDYCDIDECTSASHTCDHEATCSNTVGSFSCSCNAGYSGDGTTCNDIDECTSEIHDCDHEATCSNTVGSFSCSCNTGYIGDGTSCADIDECASESHKCHHNATCSNTDGSFSCTCNEAYKGDGTNCTERCPENWLYFADHCYYFAHSGSETIYSNAQSACRDMGANLTSIHSQEEQQFVSANTYPWPGTGIYAWSYYIGFDDIDEEGTFVWLDGTTVNYTNWMQGQPNTNIYKDEQDCVALYQDQNDEWHDSRCDTTYGYICKMEG